MLNEDYSKDISLLRTNADPRLELFQSQSKHSVDGLSKLIDERLLLNATAKTYKSSTDDDILNHEETLSYLISRIDPGIGLIYALEHSPRVTRCEEGSYSPLSGD
jgi:hypothetical protein